MTTNQLIEELDNKLKIRLTYYAMREWIVDENRSIIFNRSDNQFMIFYHDSPLPYTCSIGVCEGILNELKNKFNG